MVLTTWFEAFQALSQNTVLSSLFQLVSDVTAYHAKLDAVAVAQAVAIFLGMDQFV